MLYQEQLTRLTTEKQALGTAYTPSRKSLIVYHPRQKPLN